MAENRVTIFLIDAGEHPDRALVVLSKLKGLLLPPEEAIKRAPCPFAANVPRAAAEKVRRFLQQAGATVALADDEDVTLPTPEPSPSAPAMPPSASTVTPRKLAFESAPHNGTPSEKSLEERVLAAQGVLRSLLPQIMQQTVKPGSVSETILTAMASFVTPLEDRMQSLDVLYDAERTEARFVEFLAQCVNLGWVHDAGIEQSNLRRLIANSRELSLFRGTVEGLRRFLEIATGIAGFEIYEGAQQETASGSCFRPFHLRVLYPAQASAQANMIARIVEHEKPAYMTFEVEERPT